MEIKDIIASLEIQKELQKQKLKIGKETLINHII